jgi:hypothetical protein
LFSRNVVFFTIEGEKVETGAGTEIDRERTRGGKAGIFNIRFFKVFIKNPILPSHRKSGFIGFF